MTAIALFRCRVELLFSKNEMRRSTLLVLSLLGEAGFAQTFCDYQYSELQKYGLAAKYEQLTPEQRVHFQAQLSPEQSLGMMAARSAHQLGSAINNSVGGNYRDSMNDVFNRKLTEFRTKCGFMLK